MRRLVGVVVGLAVMAGAAGNAPAQTQATIYPDGRVFVRRTIAHPIGRGQTVVPLPMARMNTVSPPPCPFRLTVALVPVLESVTVSAPAPLLMLVVAPLGVLATVMESAPDEVSSVRTSKSEAVL